MNFNNDDISTVLGYFGEITVDVTHVVIQDNGKDEWTNLMAGTCTMLFKESKLGVFSIATVEVDGEVLRLDAGEAAGIIGALNGTEFKGRRIMVTMLTMNTPEKVKKQEVVTLSDSSPETPSASSPCSW